MDLNKIIKDINNHYPDVKVKDSMDVSDFLNIAEILRVSGFKAENDIVKTAMNLREGRKLDNVNDYYFLVFSALVKARGHKKVAYPLQQGALMGEPMEEADLAKWSKLVHKVFDAVKKGLMDFPGALDYYSGLLDVSTGEDERFKKWVKYYQDGEHQKYNSGEVDMKKNAFQFPLNSSGFYPLDTKPLPDKKEVFENSKEGFKTKEEYNQWKTKLHAALRRLDKLLRHSDTFIDVDAQSELAEQLHALDMEVRKVRLKSTASDIVFKTADRFKKAGFKEGHDILISLAQEAPEEIEDPIEDIGLEDDMPEPIPEDVPAPEGDIGDAPGVPDSPEAPAEEGGGVPTGGPESSIGGALSGGTEAGDYDVLLKNVTLEQASKKLESIAGRLADRRTIRLLAEFDIMLDNLGLASMFPELAEAQSKLIDAYSYSLVRTTKMLGMLSSGKEVEEISSAKKDEMVRKTMKDVNKTFEGEQEEPPKSTEAIKEEFEGGEDQPKPAPVPPPEEEV